MISDFSKRRSGGESRKRRKHGERENRENQRGAFQDRQADVEFGGVELQAYAQEHDLSEEEVWSRIRSGELMGRSFGGKLYIHEPDSRQGMTEMDQIQFSDDLPPLPMNADRYQDGEEQPAPEVALLLDHLSLSKEENKEILRLTQDSITRITQMTDTIIGMKDELLKSKDEQLETLREKMRAKETEVARLKQEVEDLKMLTQTLSTQQPDVTEESR